MGVVMVNTYLGMHIYANLAILATLWVFYWSDKVSLGHLGGLVAF